MNTKNKPAHKNSKPRRKQPKKITESYLHNAGLYYLERFASSSENFRRVMRRKIHKSCHAHPDQDAEKCHDMLEKLITKFEELELLDDKQYTRMMVETLRRRGKSQRYVITHLSAKGLPPELIKIELNKIDTGENADFNAALIHARKKKLGPYRRPDKEPSIQKELSNLARAGFSYDIAKKIVEMDDIYEF